MSNLWIGPAFGYNITDLCGPITYQVANIQVPFIFTDAISQGQPPKVSVYSNNPIYANPVSPYKQTYFFALTATFTRFASVIFSYATMNPIDKPTLPYIIKDECLGLTYNDPTILTFNYKNSSYYNTTSLIVYQPALKSSMAFYLQYAYYKKSILGLDFGCGPIRYSIDCQPPIT